MSRLVDGLDLAASSNKRPSSESSEYTDHPIIKRLKIQKCVDMNPYPKLFDLHTKLTVDILADKVSVGNGLYNADIRRAGVEVSNRSHRVTVAPDHATVVCNKHGVKVMDNSISFQSPERSVIATSDCIAIRTSDAVGCNIRVYSSGQIEVDRYVDKSQKDATVFYPDGKIVRTEVKTSQTLLHMPTVVAPPSIQALVARIPERYIPSIYERISKRMSQQGSK